MAIPSLYTTRLLQRHSDEQLGRETVAATVDLGDCKRDTLACLGVERAFGECAVETKIALQRGRTVGDHAEKVRHAPELFLGGLQERLGCRRCGFDRGEGIDAARDRVSFRVGMPLTAADEGTSTFFRRWGVSSIIGMDYSKYRKD